MINPLEINEDLVSWRTILRDYIKIEYFPLEEAKRIMKTRAQDPIDEPDCSMAFRSQPQAGPLTMTDGIKGVGNLKVNRKRMERECDRLETFKSFPEECPVRPHKLAKAGFFYVGLADRVECFSCGGHVEQWEYGDTAMGEHIKHFPDCPFVKKMDKRNVPLLENDQKPELTRGLSRGAQQRLNAQRDAERRAKEKEAMLLEDSLSEKSVDKTSASYSNAEDPEMSTASTFSLEDYKYEHKRLQSFENWPRINPVEPRDLAKAGFYYTNDSDNVQCFACFGQIGRWKPCDVPAVEHKHHFPNCPFVQGLDVGNVPISTPPVFSSGFQQPTRFSGVPQPTPQQRKAGLELQRQSSGQLRAYLGPLHSTRHPLYTGESARLQTFKTWPRNLRINATPSELARAGFFYTGSADEVKCFYCDGGLKNWDPNDEPWTEHAKWFPRCEWLIQQRGPAFINHVQRNTPPPFGPSRQLSLGLEEPYQQAPPNPYQRTRSAPQQQPTYLPPTRKQSPPPQHLASATSTESSIEDEKAAAFREFRERSSEPEAAIEKTFTKRKSTPSEMKPKEPSVDKIMQSTTTQMVIEMGFDEKLVRYVTVEHLMKTGKEFDSPELLLEAVWAAEASGVDVSKYDTYSEGACANTTSCLDIEDEEYPMKPGKKFDSEGSSASSLLELQERKLAGLTIHDDPSDEESIQTSGRPGTLQTQSSSMPPPSTQPFSGTTMDKDIQSLQDKQLCKICMDKELNTVFLPCKHLATCEECAAKVKECPMCRQPILSSILVFMP